MAKTVSKLGNNDLRMGKLSGAVYPETFESYRYAECCIELDPEDAKRQTRLHSIHTAWRAECQKCRKYEECCSKRRFIEGQYAHAPESLGFQAHSPSRERVEDFMSDMDLGWTYYILEPSICDRDMGQPGGDLRCGDVFADPLGRAPIEGGVPLCCFEFANPPKILKLGV